MTIPRRMRPLTMGFWIYLLMLLCRPSIGDSKTSGSSWAPLETTQTWIPSSPTSGSIDTQCLLTQNTTTSAFSASETKPPQRTTEYDSSEGLPSSSLESTYPSTNSNFIVQTDGTSKQEQSAWIVVGSVIAVSFGLAVCCCIYFRHRWGTKAGEPAEQIELVVTGQCNRPDILTVESEHGFVPVQSIITRTLSSVQDFVKEVKEKHHQSDSFLKEFKGLVYRPSKQWNEAIRESLKKKNRFKDILPFDDNRVKLTVENDDPLTDYINASYIEGFRARKLFIACIGPTPDTAADFWRMIWEQEVHVVVMVTKLVENCITKCAQYWPDTDNHKVNDMLTVTRLSEDVWPEYTLRKFRIFSSESNERIVNHFHYTAWPDKGVPANGSSLLSFRHKFNKAMMTNAPTVIHCSAGVGRTGTLIALDNLLCQAEDEGQLDVFACVNRLRQQRVYMVQTVEQYKFIYDTLALYFTVGNTTLSTVQYDEHLAALEVKDNTGVTKLQKQFDALINLEPTIKELDKTTALSPENKDKNRYHNILPRMSNRVFLCDPDQSHGSYINAVYVDGYQKVDAFLATQIPLQNTVGDFWRMVIDKGCRTIVLFMSGEDDQDSPRFLPSPTKPVNEQGNTVTMVSSANTDDIETMNIIIGKTEQENAGDDSSGNYHHVKLFKRLLVDVEQILDQFGCITLYNNVQKTQQCGGDGPILITCLNGATFCGQYIACHNALSMLKLEQEVDVFQTVCHLKSSRPEFINTMQQYRNIHDVVRAYIQMFEDYANFR